VQQLEEIVFDPQGGGDNATVRAYQLKRTALELRRAVSPLVDVCNRLMRFDLPLIPDDTRRISATSTTTSCG
jgi:magnesium transporter